MTWVIPKIVECTFRSRQAGNIVEVVHHYRLEFTGGPGDEGRDQALVDLAEMLRDAWVDNILPFQTTSLTFEGVRLVDLDVADGEVVELGSGAAGQAMGEMLPSNVAMVVKKNSRRIRGTRQGRMFIGGLVEASSTGNVWNGVSLAAFQTAMDSFRSDTTESSVITDYQIMPCVVHTKAGDPIGVSIVSSYTVEPGISHQDRRIRVR